jgi:hypothetical protein
MSKALEKIFAALVKFLSFITLLPFLLLIEEKKN